MVLQCSHDTYVDMEFDICGNEYTRVGWGFFPGMRSIFLSSTYQENSFITLPISNTRIILRDLSRLNLEDFSQSVR
jgi:hypothetical protein